MTSHLDWLRTGRAPRGTPRRRGAPRRVVAFVVLASLPIVLTGCHSGPSCGACGFLKRATDRILHRTSGCCDSGVVGGAAVEYGVPTVGAPTLVSPPYPANSAPSDVSVPGNLSPIEPKPKASIAPLPGSSSSNTGTGNKTTGYYARQTSTRTAARLDSDLPAKPASNARPAPPPAPDEAAGQDDNPLDHLPPLALPGELTQDETKLPAPSAPRPEGTSGDRPAPEHSARADAPRREDASSPALVADAAPEPDASPATPTGIARFASVDPRLSGGAAPTSAGLRWLADKGYRTVLDLRESAEVAPEFIAEVASRGLRYVALPVTLKSLDPDRLARFQFELAAPEARPLFFFDSNGACAGALWYIRRVTIEKVDPQLARREAADIGLEDPVAWQAAADYVRRIEAPRPHPAPAAPAAAPASTPDIKPEGSTKTARPEPAADSTAYAEPMNWRPVAAVLFTGLGLPLAYWTRTAIPQAIARARASLPAPAPRPRSLPDVSDA